MDHVGGRQKARTNDYRELLKDLSQELTKIVSNFLKTDARQVDYHLYVEMALLDLPHNL